MQSEWDKQKKEITLTLSETEYGALLYGLTVARYEADVYYEEMIHLQQEIKHFNELISISKGEME